MRFAKLKQLEILINKVLEGKVQNLPEAKEIKDIVEFEIETKEAYHDKEW